MDQSQINQQSEIILWTGKPLFKPYLMKHLLTYLTPLLINLVFLATCIAASLKHGEKYYDSFGFTTFTIIIILLTIQTLYKIVAYRNTQYWITKDAVYIHPGGMQTIADSIPKKKIIHIDITQSKQEEKLGAGTIVIDDGETKEDDGKEVKVYKYLYAIKDPVAAVRLLS